MGRPITKAAVALVAPADDWDAPPAEAGPVRVRCVIHNRPFTHMRGLAYGEEADVPADVAELMKSKGQVEYVGR